MVSNIGQVIIVWLLRGPPKSETVHIEDQNTENLDHINGYTVAPFEARRAVRWIYWWKAAERLIHRTPQYFYDKKTQIRKLFTPLYRISLWSCISEEFVLRP